VRTYDDAAFEAFCARLVDAGFSPVRGRSQSEWTGPLRESLRPMTDATRMRLSIYEGWPLRYAHVVVDGFDHDHVSQGIICLWAEDDPAQVEGRDLDVLWARLDEWAATAQRGFRPQDRALDAFMLFEERSTHRAELPFEDLVAQGTNGFRAPLSAVVVAQHLLKISAGEPEPADDAADTPALRGTFYLRRDIGTPPRTMDDVRSLLTRRQRADLEHGLADRAPTGTAEPSGGYDFVVIAWPRHDQEHDAVVLLFEHHDESLKAFAIEASSNTVAARLRRAGPDAALLADKTVLIAGAGSVGGQVALTLACSGVGTLRMHDDDTLTTANLVRHVGLTYAVGYGKPAATEAVIADHAPWTAVERLVALSHNPDLLLQQIQGVDLVVDCSGIFSVRAVLSDMCWRHSIPLISGALFHQGALARIQRQTEKDESFAGRRHDPRYLSLPPEDASAPDQGFLELGCTAPVNNAPPVAVTTTAADISHLAIDHLTGRGQRTNDRIIVLRPMDAPFDSMGVIDLPINEGERP
jgi:molybdopterin/thiamine biosynthesis adenylyltransferase